MTETGVPDGDGRKSPWRFSVAVSAVLVSAVLLMVVLVSSFPSPSPIGYNHSGPSVLTSGGGASCPNPAFWSNPSIHDPPPSIARVKANYSYTGVCYNFSALTSYSSGEPLAGAVVNVSIWPATGPGSWGSPPPANFTCGMKTAADSTDVCVYVPPPAYWASGITGGNGTLELTIGMPLANYTAQVVEWIDGTETIVAGEVDSPATGTVEAIGN
jgi:hypothetical protein